MATPKEQPADMPNLLISKPAAMAGYMRNGERKLNPISDSGKTPPMAGMARGASSGSTGNKANFARTGGNLPLSPSSKTIKPV